MSNATLHWVPGHLDLLAGLVARIRPGGWFGFQVPGNFEEPSHTIRRDLAAETPYAEQTRGVTIPAGHGAAGYLRMPQPLVRSVDAWETTYLHVLQGEDPVFTWVLGTSAGPVVQALDDGLRPRFVAEFKARLRAAYPTVAASCCRSAGCSWWPRHEPPASRAGLLPGRWRGCAAVVLGRRNGLTEVEKPKPLRGRGGCWFRSYDELGAVSAEIHVGVEADFRPDRKAHPALVVDDLDAVAETLRAGGRPVDLTERETFPGYERLHTTDPHGNRVEVLQAR